VPALIRLYLRHVVIDFGLGAVFVTLLLGLNVANLGHLVLTSDMAVVAVAMLVAFNGIVFAGVQFAIAAMRMEERAMPPRTGPLVPVPVRVVDRRG
jgi:hypothetical protein